MQRWRAAFVGCCSSALLACSASESATFARQLSVHDAWARAADSGATGAVYFMLVNDGPDGDTLVAVTSEEAEGASLHVSTQQGRMMHMSLVTTLPLPAEDSVSFRPLGAHVMLAGLKRPLIEGDSVSAMLTFASGRTVGVIAGVRRP